jgi:glycosidase
MQWDATPGGGFGSEEPWLPMNPDWRERSVAAQRGRSSSLLEWYRALIQLRRAMPALRRGSLRWTPASREVLAFERADEETGERVAVFLNFASRAGRAALSEDAVVLMGSARGAGQALAAGGCAFGPNESLIVRLKPLAEPRR